MSIPVPNQPKWNPTVYNFRVPHALALVESKNLICVADRENGAVQCFNNSDGTFEFSVPCRINRLLGPFYPKLGKT